MKEKDEGRKTGWMSRSVDESNDGGKGRKMPRHEQRKEGRKDLQRMGIHQNVGVAGSAAAGNSNTARTSSVTKH